MKLKQEAVFFGQLGAKQGLAQCVPALTLCWMHGGQPGEGCPGRLHLAARVLEVLVQQVNMQYSRLAASRCVPALLLVCSSMPTCPACSSLCTFKQIHYDQSERRVWRLQGQGNQFKSCGILKQQT